MNASIQFATLNADECAAVAAYGVFTSTHDLPISQTARRIIVAQPGYRRGEQMVIGKTADGTEYRLYVAVSVGWMDASLRSICE